MILLALKSLFFVTAILGYSTGVWRLINNYFQQEFKTYLAEEVKKNKYLVMDPATVGESPPPPAGSPIVTEDEVKQAGRSVTANRLLDEMIVNFGRLFTTRNEPEFPGKRTSAIQTKEFTTASSNERQGSIPDPDPSPTRQGGTIIESDKFRRSSPSGVDNKSDDDDDADGGDEDDEEEKWIKYWKNRNQGGVVDAEGGGWDGGHCEAKLDACGP